MHLDQKIRASARPMGHLIRISKIRLVMMLLLSFVFDYIDGAIQRIFHSGRKQFLKIFKYPFIMFL